MRILLCSLLTVFVCFQPHSHIDKHEAKDAFLYLNQIRQHPQQFVDSFSFLRDIKPMARLKWNDTLAMVAERKAQDMAQRNYFAHVDPDGYGMNYYINQFGYTLKEEWLNKKSSNYFESCNAGAHSGKEAIKMLLDDDGVPSLGHRIHLLGMDFWSASLVDIGIGYARSESDNKYISYTCILIAKHQ